jgi:hypothetical protein
LVGASLVWPRTTISTGLITQGCRNARIPVQMVRDRHDAGATNHGVGPVLISDPKTSTIENTHPSWLLTWVMVVPAELMSFDAAEMLLGS